METGSAWLTLSMNESALRVTLESLFYKDAILPHLKRIGINRMKEYFEWKMTAQSVRVVVVHPIRSMG